MPKTPRSSKDHRETMFVTGVNYPLVADGTTGLYHGGNARVTNDVNAVAKRKKGVRSQNGTPYIFTTLFKCHMNCVYTADLSRPQPYGCVVFCNENSIGFYMA